MEERKRDVVNTMHEARVKDNLEKESSMGLNVYSELKLLNIGSRL